MLYEVLGDIWVVRSQSLPAGRPDRQSEAPRASSSRPCITGWREVEKRRDPTDERRSPKVSQLLSAARAAVDRFAAHFPDMIALRKRARRALLKHTRADNIRFDAYARVAHVTDATDWRVELPFLVLTPDTEAEIPHLVRELHRARPHHHPARRRHGLHGRRRAAHALVAP